MVEILKRHLGAGSVAWLANGVGPRIAFAPEKEGDGDGSGAGGNGSGDGSGRGDGDGDGKGAGNGNDGDKNGAAGTGAGGDGGAKGTGQPSKLKDAGGLLGTRKKGEGDGKGDGEGEPKPGADGRPAHVPEKFWDAKTKTVKHDDLAKAYSTLEKSFGDLKRSKGVGDDVPESPEEYFKDGLELDKEVDRLAIEGPDDPGLKAWGKIAHKYGVGKETAINIAKEMFKEMNASAPAPVDLEQERDALGANADELIDGVFIWLEQQETGGKFGGDDIDVALSISHTAEGIRFLNKVRSMSGEKPIPLGLPAGNRGMSQEDWHTEMREAVKKQDYKRQEELEQLGPSIFGTESSTGSPIAGIPNQKDVDRSARK